jgi:hypothetical protein
MKPAFEAISRGLGMLALLIVALTATARADAFDDARATYDRGDFGSARDLFRPLAEMGDRRAQTMMGHFYIGGRGFPKDITEAAKWYTLAARQGEPVAEFQMFFVEAELAFVQHRPMSDERILWLRNSAEQDVPESQMILSFMLRDGKDISRDAVESLKWLKRAAEFGHPFAMDVLASYYERGKAGDTDLAEAYFWILACIKQDSRAVGVVSFFAKEHIATRDRLSPQLSAEVRAGIERRAADWAPRPLPPFQTLILTPQERGVTAGNTPSYVVR